MRHRPRSSLRTRSAARSRSSERGASTPLLGLLFLVCFGLGFGGVYLARRDNGKSGVVAVTSIDTTLPTDTTGAPDSSLSLATSTSVETTVAALTSVADTTTPPPVTDPPTTAPPASSVARAAPVLGTQGAFLAAPADVQVRSGGPEQGCDSLTISQSARDCAGFEAAGARWAWVIDDSGVLEVLRADLQPDGTAQWPVVMRSRADVASVKIVDVNGDGNVDLVASRGSPGKVDVDVVEIRNGRPEVTLHLGFSGRVIVSDGQIDLWADAGDGVGVQDHFVVRSEGGGWVVV